MKIAIPVTAILIGAQFVFIHATAQAERIIPTVVSSPTRSDESYNQGPTQLTVISREEIESSGAVHLTDVLRGRGAIQLIDTFGNGARATIGMRGFGESANANTLILVDGRRLNNMDIAAPDLNSISLKDVERVEIINGSASVLYGDQAVGGVVNIITRRPDALVASVALGAGSYGGSGLQAQVSQRFDSGLSVRLTGEQRESDGYRDNSELNYKNILALAGYEYTDGSLFVEMQSTDEKLNTPGALYVSEARIDRRTARPEYLNDYVDTKTDVFRAGIKHRLSGNWVFESEFTYRESDGEFLQSFRNAAETIPATQRRRVNSVNPRFIGRFDMNDDQLLLTLGHDYDDSRYRLSTRFGPQSNDQKVSSWYGQAIVPLNQQLQLSVGARSSKVENDLQDGGAFARYPNGVEIDDRINVGELGLSYRPNQRWRWQIRAAETYRFAKVDEYLSPFGGQVLKNQTGISYEAGVAYHGRQWAWSVTAYELDLDNELAFDPNSFSNLNLDRTERKGLNLNASYRFNSQWQFAADYGLVDADVISGSFSGNQVPLVSEHMLRLKLGYYPDRHWRFSGELHAISNRPYSGDFTNTLDELAGYGVINLNASYERQGWQLQLRLNNLLDKKYAEFGARSDEFPPPAFTAVSFESIQPSPERNIWLTAGYQFH